MGKEWAQMGMIMLALFVFGIGYNAVVARFQKRTDRYTAELVVGGVLVTLFGAGFLVGIEAVLLVVMCFIASGLPMLIGSWLRNAEDDATARQVAKDFLDDGE